MNDKELKLLMDVDTRNAQSSDRYDEGNNVKLMFLLDVLGEPLPELEDLAKLPREVLHFLDIASPNELRAMLIEVVGRWDLIKTQQNSL